MKSRWRQSYPHGSAGHSPCHSALQGPQPQGMGRGHPGPPKLDRRPHPLKPLCSPPQVLALWACDGYGSPEDFGTTFNDVLLLSGRIAPSFPLSRLIHTNLLIKPSLGHTSPQGYAILHLFVPRTCILAASILLLLSRLSCFCPHSIYHL